MSENAKTIAFVVVGLLAITVGIVSRPSSGELDEQTLVGVNLTDSFDSTDEAKQLRIVRFDEDTATLREFEVAEQDGLWSIPSKNGYPADAARQMAEAATSLTDRKILGIATSNAGDHEEFGVVDPRSSKLEVGQKGVGTRVTMSDVHDAPLADLIIGKPVKDAEGQRYVREAGRDIVYIIEIDPTKLSTNFEDWIEKDLLKLNSWDLQQVQIKDYSAELTPVMTQEGLRFQLAGDMRSEMTLDYNDTDSKWNAAKLRKFDLNTKSYADFTLAEDEELNSETLNGLKTALDDLQIVDVVRKPQGLSNDLKAGADFMNNVEALQDLVSKGFTPAQSQSGSGQEEIISSDGEVIATMKNGTEYVLRFGNLTNVGTEGGDSKQAQATSADAAGNASPSNKDGGVHRYLFAMARFNESAIKRPELQELPELPAEANTSTATDEADAADAAQDKPADENADDESTTESTDSAEPTANEEPATSAETNTETATGAETDDDEAQSGEQADTEGDTEAGAQNESDESTGAANASDTSTSTDEPKSDTENITTDQQPQSAKEGDVKNIIAERKRIEQENQRKLDEYQESLKKGQENVKDLNLRFGDWYFVVADDVFKKIRLSRENVIKKKEKKPDSEGNADQQQGETSAIPPGIIPGLPQLPGTNQQ